MSEYFMRFQKKDYTKKTIIFSLLSLLIAPLSIEAQTITATPLQAVTSEKINYRPVAIVNDTPITPIDIENRIAFLRLINNIPDAVSLSEKDQNQVLKDLIEERIKQRETARFKIKITDQRVEGAFKAAANNLGLSPSKFSEKLHSNNITPTYFENVTRHKMAWEELLQGRYARDITVSTYEVAQIIESNATTQGMSAVYHQIILPIEGTGNAAQEKIQAELTKISARLNGGEAFEEIAKIYQQDAQTQITQTKLLADLPPELAKNIILLQAEQVSQPIKIDNNIALIQLVDKQKGDTSSINQRMLVKAGALDYNENIEIQQKNNDRQELSNKSDLCENYDDYFDNVIVFDNTTISELPEALRAVAKSASLNEIRIVREAKDSDYVLTICNIKEIDYYNDAPKALRSKIRNQIFSRKLELKNKEYYRDLKKSAVVTIFQ
ncbi:MAG: parvulin-like peptidyl-prolyl isomerase [Alphaproteobacteria bacterium]|jgi:parvulin-like peptidyl-prolyl isomerase